VGDLSGPDQGFARRTFFHLHKDGTLDFGYGPGLEANGLPVIHRDRVYFSERAPQSRVGEVHLPFRTLGDSLMRPDVEAPEFYVEPAGREVHTGQRVLLQAAVRNGPAEWLWQKDGIDLPNSNTPYLSFLTDENSAGWYRVRASNKAGTAYSEEILIDVSDRKPGRIDDTFHPPDLSQQDLAWNYVGSAAIQKDERALLALDERESSRLVRLLPDGSLDSSFVPELPAPDTRIRHLSLQPDGKILGGSITEDFANAMWRLNRDGSRDPAFRPKPPIGDWVQREIFPVAAAPFSWRDKLFVPLLFQTSEGGGFFLEPPYFPFRFDSDGSNPVSLGVALGSDLSLGDPSGVVLGADALYHGSRSWIGGNLDLDPGFQKNAEALGASVRAADPSGGLYATIWEAPFAKLVRLTPEGRLDPSFRPHDFSYLFSVVADDRGVYVVGRFERVGGWPRRRIARIKPDGTIDHRFDPGAGLDKGYARLLRYPSGDLLLYGTTFSYDGQAENYVLRVLGVGEPESLAEVVAPTTALLAEGVGKRPEEATTEDLERLSWLDATSRELTSLTGLERSRHLRGVVLDDNPITDLTPLASMPSLATLSIRGIDARSLDPLLERPPRNLVVDPSQASRFAKDLAALPVTTRVYVVPNDEAPSGNGLEVVRRTRVVAPQSNIYAPPLQPIQFVLTWDTGFAPGAAFVQSSADLRSWKTQGATAASRERGFQ
jgi:hypothetical protein